MNRKFLFLILFIFMFLQTTIQASSYYNLDFSSNTINLNNNYDLSNEDYEWLYNFITNYNHYSDSYIFFNNATSINDSMKKYICYDPVFSSNGTNYTLDCSRYLRFLDGINNTSIWKNYTPADTYNYDSYLNMNNRSFQILYSHNVNNNDLGIDGKNIKFNNIGNSINSSFNGIDDIYICSNNDYNFRGLLNILYESDIVEYTYNVNYFFNDELDSSKSYSSTAEANSTITIINKSNQEFSVDNNEYEYTLDEDNKEINIYYYDSYFGTDYELIDTNNTHIPFNFSVKYLNTIFPKINFNKFNQFQQFVICILINILFILFVWFIVHFVRIAFAYLMRLF